MFRRQKIPAILAVAVALVCATLFLFRNEFLLAMGDYLVVRDELQPVDVIHVIAGEDDRTDYAIQLYQQGYGRQIFFTGGWCAWHNYYHGQHGQELALEQGVPPEAIAIDDSPVTSTYSETVRLKEFIARSEVPIRSVIVVSDAYHMRRARWTYKYVLGTAINTRMAPVPFSMTRYQPRWWEDEVSRQYVKQEYLKIAYYVARYQLAFGRMKDWLASLDSQ